MGPSAYPSSALRNSRSQRSQSAYSHSRRSSSVSFKETNEILGLSPLSKNHFRIHESNPAPIFPDEDPQYDDEIPPPPPLEDESSRQGPPKLLPTPPLPGINGGSNPFRRPNLKYANRRTLSLSPGLQSYLSRRESDGVDGMPQKNDSAGASDFPDRYSDEDLEDSLPLPPPDIQMDDKSSKSQQASITSPKIAIPVIPLNINSDKDLASLKERLKPSSSSRLTTRLSGSSLSPIPDSEAFMDSAPKIIDKAYVDRDLPFSRDINGAKMPTKTVTRKLSSPQARMAIHSTHATEDTKKSVESERRMRSSLSSRFDESKRLTSPGLKNEDIYMSSPPVPVGSTVVDASVMEFENSIKVSDLSYKIGDAVEIRRSNGTWVEGIVLRVDLAAHGIIVEYASDGALYQKKLKFDSPMIAPSGTHLSKFQIGEIVECLDKDRYIWIEGEVVEISAEKILVQYHRDGRYYQKRFVSGSPELRKKEETLISMSS